MSRSETVAKSRKEGNESNLRAQLEEAIRQRDQYASQLSIVEREAAELRESVFELSLRLSDTSGENGPTLFSLSHGEFYTPQLDESINPIDNDEKATSSVHGGGGGENSEGSASPTLSSSSVNTNASSSFSSVQQPLSNQGKQINQNQSQDSGNVNGTLLGGHGDSLQYDPSSPMFSPHKPRTSVLEELSSSKKLSLHGISSSLTSSNSSKVTNGTSIKEDSSMTSLVNDKANEKKSSSSSTVNTMTSTVSNSSIPLDHGREGGLSPGSNVKNHNLSNVGDDNNESSNNNTKKSNNNQRSVQSKLVNNSSDSVAQRTGSRPGLGMTAELRGHTGAVYSIRFSHDGEWLCSGGFDSKVCLWDVKAQAESSQKLNGHTQPVSSVAIESDDCCVVTGSYDKSVRRWDVQTGTETSRVAINGMVQAVALGDELSIVDSSLGNQNPSSLAFIGSTDRSLIVADHRVGSVVATWRAPAPITSVYCYDEEGSGGRVLSADASGSVLIWDCRTGTISASHNLGSGGGGGSGSSGLGHRDGSESVRHRRSGGSSQTLHISSLACVPLQTESYEGVRSEGPFTAAVCGDNSLRVLERLSHVVRCFKGPSSIEETELQVTLRPRHVLRGPQLRNWPIGAAWWRGLHHKPPKFSAKGTSASSGNGGGVGVVGVSGGVVVGSETAQLDLLTQETSSTLGNDRVKQLPWSHALVLACGSADGKIHLYDASSLPRSPLPTTPFGTGGNGGTGGGGGPAVMDDKTSDSSSQVLPHHDNGSVPLGLASSGAPQLVQVLASRSPGDRTYCVDWHPHEPCLASGSADGIVRLWQPVARQVAKTSNTRASRR